MKRILLSLLLIFMFFTNYSWAANQSDNQMVEETIKNWFLAMKNNEVDKAASFLAPQFLSIHTDGIVRDKSQEVKLIKNLNMKYFQLTNFKFSKNGDVIVVTYVDKGVENIDSQPIATKKAGRMAVLQKQNKKWLIIAYANLDEIK